MNKFQKAAMFGLDARIALAIFGALSVITGASLFSATKEAKTVAFVTFLNEMTKASEAHLLDTGEYIPHVNIYNFNAKQLVLNSSNFTNWNGPYIEGVYISGGHIRSKYSNSIHGSSYLNVYLQKSSTWAFNTSILANSCSSVGDPDCAEYITILSGGAYLQKALELFTSLDEKVDGSDGNKAGNVRMYTNGIIMYKGMPRKRTI